MRRAAKVAGGALFVVVALGGYLVLSSDYEQRPTGYIGQPGDRHVPGWTRSCWRLARGRSYMLACARVRGRVVYVERNDPDGDGDAHVVVVAGVRLVVVKFRKRLGGSGPCREVPGVGRRIDAAGLVGRNAQGLSEIDTCSSPVLLGPRSRRGSEHSDTAGGRRGPAR